MRKPKSTAKRCKSVLLASNSPSRLALSVVATNTTLLKIVGCGYISTMSVPSPFLLRA